MASNSSFSEFQSVVKLLSRDINANAYTLLSADPDIIKAGVATFASTCDPLPEERVSVTEYTDNDMSTAAVSNNLSRPGYTYIISTIIMAIIVAGISNYFNKKISGTSIMVTRICLITYDYVCVAGPSGCVHITAAGVGFMAAFFVVQLGHGLLLGACVFCSVGMYSLDSVTFISIK